MPNTKNTVQTTALPCDAQYFAGSCALSSDYYGSLDDMQKRIKHLEDSNEWLKMEIDGLSRETSDARD